MTFEKPISKLKSLKIRLAKDDHDVRAAQRLRYEVFHTEMNVTLSAKNHLAGREQDEFDGYCDHLLIIREGEDPAAERAVSDGEVVGTYRLLRKSIAVRSFGFYSQAEFDIESLIAKKPDLEFLELGRSCVLQSQRGTAVIELLWQGIWDYVRSNRIDVMFGCASFEGADFKNHQIALNFLHHNALAPPEWRVYAQPHRRAAIDIYPSVKLEQRAIINSLPPLIKGYLRLGAYIGDGAVVDTDFNTTDVLIILPVAKINPRFFARFGEPTN